MARSARVFQFGTCTEGTRAFGNAINAGLSEVLRGLGAATSGGQVGPLYNGSDSFTVNPNIVERLGNLIQKQTPLPGANVSVKDDPAGLGKVISVPDTPVTVPGTGIGVNNTPTGPQIINTGVISVQAGTGISAAGTNPCVVSNTGIISLSAGPGIQLAGTNPAVIQVDQIPYTLTLGGGAQAFVNSYLYENDTMYVIVGYAGGGTGYIASFARVLITGRTFVKASCIVSSASGTEYRDSSSASGSGVCTITGGDTAEASPVTLPNTGFRFEFILQK